MMLTLNGDQAARLTELVGMRQELGAVLADLPGVGRIDIRRQSPGKIRFDLLRTGGPIRVGCRIEPAVGSTFRAGAGQEVVGALTDLLRDRLDKLDAELAEFAIHISAVGPSGRICGETISFDAFSPEEKSVANCAGKPAPTAREERADGLPFDCPVAALGFDGDECVFFDPDDKLRRINVKHLGRSQLLGLFGARADWLYANYPRTDQDGNFAGWRPEAVGTALRSACNRQAFMANGLRDPRRPRQEPRP